MKKFILTVLGSLIISSSCYGKEIQLTDYRYINGYIGTDGYSYANQAYDYLTDTENPDKKDYITVQYSHILSPDGTELFAPNQYYIWAPVKDNVYALPQFNGRFVVKEAENGSSSNHNCLVDKNGQIYARWDYLLSHDYFINDGLISFFNSSGLVNVDKNFVINAANDAKSDGEVITDAQIKISTDGQYYEISAAGSSVDSLNDQGNGKLFTEKQLCFYYDSSGSRIEKPENVTFVAVQPSSEYENMELKKDNSYKFKGKEIGGKTYYALFKELEENESMESLAPAEQPSEWAEDSINKLTENGLLYNNSKCFYNNGITREDFCILAVESFFKAQDMDIDEYLSNNNIVLDFEKFDDTDNIYILLANELGIAKGMSQDIFAPKEKITRQQAAVMLNNMARLAGLEENATKVEFDDMEYFADWARDAIFNVSSIKNNEGEAIMTGTRQGEFSPCAEYTREQAYTTLCRLYEMCK